MTITTSDRPPIASWQPYLSGLWARRDFARFLIKGNLAARNASTTLGLMWWILHPLFAAAVYFLVFGVFLDGGGADIDFLSYLVVGVFTFQFTTTAMTGGANLVQQNASLLVNIAFPRLILPIAATVESLVAFLISLIAVAAIILARQIVPGLTIVWLLPTVALHTIFSLGLSALTARWVVPFRDIDNLIPHLTRFWFYLTPVIWTLDTVAGLPEWTQFLIRLNPMYAIVQLYRVALLNLPFESADLVTATGWAVGICLLGLYSFSRNEGAMVRYL